MPIDAKTDDRCFSCFDGGFFCFEGISKFVFGASNVLLFSVQHESISKKTCAVGLLKVALFISFDIDFLRKTKYTE